MNMPLGKKLLVGTLIAASLHVQAFGADTNLTAAQWTAGSLLERHLNGGLGLLESAYVDGRICTDAFINPPPLTYSASRHCKEFVGRMSAMIDIDTQLSVLLKVSNAASAMGLQDRMHRYAEIAREDVTMLRTLAVMTEGQAWTQMYPPQPMHQWIRNILQKTEGDLPRISKELGDLAESARKAQEETTTVTTTTRQITDASGANHMVREESTSTTKQAR